jgi:release factor glutamine methyltransferase
VREHEPEAALFGGESGAEIYAPLIVQAAARLKPGGFLVTELGHDSLQHVTRILDTRDWTSITTKNDLAGIPRVIAAQRRG